MEDGFNLFFRLLDGDNRILKWTAIDVLGKLAAGDRQRAPGVVNKLVAYLGAGNLITANHAAGALADIAAAQKEHRERITH